MIRVIGIDLSLTATGIARLGIGDGAAVGLPVPLQTYTDVIGVPGEAAATLVQRWHRLDATAQAICEQLGSSNNLAVIEGPAPSTGDQRGSFDTAHLWWSVVGHLLANAVPVAVVAPGTLKVYATGNGRARKPEIVRAVRAHYGDAFDGVTDHNVADAVALAALGARHLGVPIDTLPDIHTRALASVKWPTTTPGENT